MEFLHAIKLLAVLVFVHGAYGQTLALTGPSTVQQGNNTVFTCTVNGGSAATFVWVENAGESAIQIYIGPTRFSEDTKYNNFQLTSTTATTSELTIESTAVEDEGSYACSIPSGPSNNIDLIVEVPSRHSLTLSSRYANSEDLYVATCEATGGKPIETISWTLDGVSQSDDNGNSIEDSNPADPPLFSNTKSVFTFPANIDNYEQTLVCDINGHTLTELNGQESIGLDIHTSPVTANTVVTIGWVTQGSDITVSCTAENQPIPTMRNYYIYSNDTLIHASTTGDSDVTVSNPEAGTQYTCMAGNYLGNTSISAPDPYDPTRTTTPPPTTAVNTLSTGAIVGIVIGVLLFVIIITVLFIVFVLKPECVSGLGSGSGGASSKKHSSVGSSNGNEKEQFKPTPTPRVQSSITHTKDNPQEAEYAMVDRKPKTAGGGGDDMPDTRGKGAGQNEPPGMLYADLDLTANAGHTERQVPQNPDNVVVYSSILV